MNNTEKVMEIQTRLLQLFNKVARMEKSLEGVNDTLEGLKTVNEANRELAK